jgi:hypothetical protein
MNNLAPFCVNRRRCPFPTTTSSQRHLCAHSVSALKIAPCRRPSKPNMVSYCQLSAVTCQPLFSFSPGAATAACGTALSFSDLFFSQICCELSAARYQLPASFLRPFNFRLSTLNLFLSRYPARACFPLLAVGGQLSAASFSLSPLQSALTKNVPLTPLESALTISLDLKSFRIRTYKKTGGGGGQSPVTELQPPLLLSYFLPKGAPCSPCG